MMFHVKQNNEKYRFLLDINITAWNLKKTRIEVHKPIKLICKWFYTIFLSYSGSKQRFLSTKLFISIPIATKHALLVQF